MSNVSKRPIGSLVSLRTEKAAADKNPDLAYVGLEHIISNGFALTGFARADSSISTNSVFYKGDILFGKLRPNLKKSIRAPFDGYCSTDILVLQPADNVHPGYVARVFQRDEVFAEAVRTAEGTKMPRTSWSKLKHFLTYVPNENKSQEAVSNTLDAVENAIRFTGLRLEKLLNLRWGVLNDLLISGIDSGGKTRLDRLSAPELYKDSEVGWVSVDWEVSGLRDRATPDRMYLRTGPFGSSLKEEHWVPEGIPVVTIGSLGEGEFITSELLYVSPETASSLKEYSLVRGDVVFSRVADVGRSAVIGPDEEGWIMSSNMMRIHLDGNNVRPEFLHLLLRFDKRIRAQIRINVNAGGREIANGNVLNKIQFPWPPIPEQDRILRVANAFTDSISVERKLLTKLCQLKSGLMTDLLDGRVPVAPQETLLVATQV